MGNVLKLIDLTEHYVRKTVGVGSIFHRTTSKEVDVFHNGIVQ